MKDPLKQFWQWDGIDYLIQIGMILVFAYGFMYASEANQVLEAQGCQQYWSTYHTETNLSNKVLVNSTEKAYLKQYGRMPKASDEPSELLNKTSELNKSLVRP